MRLKKTPFFYPITDVDQETTRLWNNGKLECWNNGMMGFSLFQHSIIPSLFSIIPVFQFTYV